MTEKTFTELFPSLKDNDYCDFNQIQKDKLIVVCLDKQRVKEAIEKYAFHSENTLLTNAECVIKELNLEDK